MLILILTWVFNKMMQDPSPHSCVCLGRSFLYERLTFQIELHTQLTTSFSLNQILRPIPYTHSQCLYGNEHIVAHDALRHIVVVIDLENEAHVQKEVSHFSPCQIEQQMDILVTKDNFQTLMDIVIVDLTHIDMVQRTLMAIEHVAMMVAQEKT